MHYWNSFSLFGAIDSPRRPQDTAGNEPPTNVPGTHTLPDNPGVNITATQSNVPGAVEATALTHASTQIPMEPPRPPSRQVSRDDESPDALPVQPHLPQPLPWNPLRLNQMHQPPGMQSPDDDFAI